MRAVLAISAHGLPEQAAGGSGARLGHGGSAVAGCKGVASEAPAQRLAQALGAAATDRKYGNPGSDGHRHWVSLF